MKIDEQIKIVTRIRLNLGKEAVLLEVAMTLHLVGAYITSLGALSTIEV